MRILFGLSVVLSVAVGLHVFLGNMFIEGAGLTGLSRVAAWTVLVGLFCSIPLSFLAMRAFDGPMARLVAWVGYLWMGAIGLLLPAALLGEGVFQLASFSVASFSPQAWRWWQVWAVFGGSGVLMAYAVAVARRGPWVERVAFSSPKLPKVFNGLRVVQLSDVHIGATLDGRFLQRVVNQVNGLRPDVVAITGDLVDGSVEQLRPHLSALRSLQATHGVYFVTGNHEYYSGGPQWAAEVARHGITVLHNEHRVIEKEGAQLVIAGITDWEGGRFHPEHASRPDVALKGAPSEAFRLLLAHQPRSARLAAPHGVDLQLSGHTHGGQIFPFNFLVPLQQPAVAGLKEISGVWVYTHKGTGYWGPPMRLGPKGEIAEIVLQHTPSDTP